MDLSILLPSRRRGAVRYIVAMVAATLSLACTLRASAADYVATVVASGLNSPRGLGFAPDGSLWVTEAGLFAGASGPTTIVRGMTATYNDGGSLTRIFGGTQARVLSGLPSLVLANGEVTGPSDIAFGPSGQLTLLVGAGLDPNLRFTALAPVGHQLGRLVTPGSAIDIAAHEAQFNPAGGVLDSNPWHMAAAPGGGMFVADAGSNTLLRVAANGSVSTAAVFPPRAIGGPGPSDAVPTGVAVGPDGTAYVAELTGFPFTAGAARIYRVAADGSMAVFATGFTMLTDIAFGSDGTLYALEYDSNGSLVPGVGGTLWQVASDGTRTSLWGGGIAQATGLAIGPDGAFYISNRSIGDGLGEVLRISSVPEVPTLVLMASGLLGVVRLTRRRLRPFRILEPNFSSRYRIG